MRPKLILQPITNTSTKILQSFALSKPLSSEQRNFLEWNEKQLSSKEFDPIYKYYIESDKKRHMDSFSFLLPSEKINIQSLEQFKKRLKLFIHNNLHGVTLRFTEKQFAAFEQVKMSELIFWHGNQLLTGAPFFPGGIPPVIYFQLGNYFGVAKYIILPEERALKANILVYFEDMRERNLNECVNNYQKQLRLDTERQNKILYEHKVNPVEYKNFLIRTPTLILDPTKRLHSPY